MTFADVCFAYNRYKFLFSLAVFIYSMPSSGCTIKERMLYSSCKQPFLQAALSAANLAPDKKVLVLNFVKIRTDKIFNRITKKVYRINENVQIRSL